MTRSTTSLRDSPLLDHVNLGGFDPEKTRHAELIERRKKHFAGSFLFYQDPVQIVRGKGAHLFDERDRRYLDFYNNVQSMGHGNPDIARAVSSQMGKLATHTRYLNTEVIELAEEAAQTLPGDLDVCFFVCSGTEAAELAMRIARVVTGRSGAIVMENSYHGNSKLVGEMSTATYPAEKRPPHIQAIEPPNTYRGPFRSGEGDDGTLGVRYADLVDPAIAQLDQNGEGLAAFVCDTVFDSNGCLEAPDDYFTHVYRKVRAASGLCIADEVQAGVCRTGTYWGFEQYGVEPDIVFTGKPFGGGYPVAAVFTTREIAEYWSARDVYFNTFGGNPVAAAAAKAVIRYARKKNIQSHVKETGAYLLRKVQDLARKHPIIGNIQGKGLFVGIELITDPDTRAPANDIARLIPDAMKNEGVLIGLSGRLGNRLKCRPPLVATKGDVDHFITALDKVLSALVDKGKTGQIPPSGRINEGVVNERDLARFAATGAQVLTAAPGVVITPLAHDKARDLGIIIEHDTL